MGKLATITIPAAVFTGMMLLIHNQRDGIRSAFDAWGIDNHFTNKFLGIAQVVNEFITGDWNNLEIRLIAGVKNISEVFDVWWNDMKRIPWFKEAFESWENFHNSLLSFNIIDSITSSVHALGDSISSLGSLFGLEIPNPFKELNWSLKNLEANLSAARTWLESLPGVGDGFKNFFKAADVTFNAARQIDGGVIEDQEGNLHISNKPIDSWFSTEGGAAAAAEFLRNAKEGGSINDIATALSTMNYALDENAKRIERDMRVKEFNKWSKAYGLGLDSNTMYDFSKVFKEFEKVPGAIKNAPRWLKTHVIEQRAEESVNKRIAETEKQAKSYVDEKERLGNLLDYQISQARENLEHSPPEAKKWRAAKLAELIEEKKAYEADYDAWYRQMQIEQGLIVEETTQDKLNAAKDELEKKKELFNEESVARLEEYNMQKKQMLEFYAKEREEMRINSELRKTQLAIDAYDKQLENKEDGNSGSVAGDIGKKWTSDAIDKKQKEWKDERQKIYNKYNSNTYVPEGQGELIKDYNSKTIKGKYFDFTDYRGVDPNAPVEDESREKRV